jgi:hypothetical protein
MEILYTILLYDEMYLMLTPPRHPPLQIHPLPPLLPLPLPPLLHPDGAFYYSLLLNTTLCSSLRSSLYPTLYSTQTYNPSFPYRWPNLDGFGLCTLL